MRLSENESRHIGMTFEELVELSQAQRAVG